METIVITKEELSILQLIERKGGASPMLEIAALCDIDTDKTIETVKNLQKRGVVRIFQKGGDDIRFAVVVLKRSWHVSQMTAYKFIDICLAVCVGATGLYFFLKWMVGK